MSLRPRRQTFTVARDSWANLAAPKTTPRNRVARSLLLAFPTREALLERLGGARGALVFVPGVGGLRLGERFCLDLAVADEMFSLQLPALVRWIRKRGTESLPPGIGVELQDANGRPTSLRWALQSIESGNRRARRFHARFPAQCEFVGRLSDGLTHDISKTGAYIRSDRILPRGARIHLTLTAMDGDPINVLALVAREGKEAPRGMGLRFVHVSPGEAEKLFRMLDTVKRMALAG